MEKSSIQVGKHTHLIYSGKRLLQGYLLWNNSLH